MVSTGTTTGEAVDSTSMSGAASRRATFADLEARPEKPYAEVIGGAVVEKAMPRWDHAMVQGQLGARLVDQYGLTGRPGDRPGGWWLLTECTIELEPHEIYQPDLSGWRRERVAAAPREHPVRLRPDWVCEILSPSNRRHDTIDKLRVYQRSGIAHYWLIDPEAGSLTVFRNQDGAFIVALAAGREERVRAEPFDAVEMSVGELCGGESEAGRP
jgi:Uma2 family endonuclease